MTMLTKLHISFRIEEWIRFHILRQDMCYYCGARRRRSKMIGQSLKLPNGKLVKNVFHYCDANCHYDKWAEEWVFGSSEDDCTPRGQTTQ